MDQLERDIQEVFSTTPRYAMYTRNGDKMVAEIVKVAEAQRWNWPETYQALKNLARAFPDVAGEATDTAVREVVYDKLGFTSPFYI